MKKIFIVSAALLSLVCQQNKNNSDYKPGDEPKFYSKDNPGKWQNMENEHNPDITISNEKGEKMIDVKIGITQTPSHYVELILLADHQHKELAKIDIGRLNAPHAIFKLPATYRSKAYVIMKCNLHDMWESELVFD